MSMDEDITIDVWMYSIRNDYLPFLFSLDFFCTFFFTSFIAEQIEGYRWDVKLIK